MIFPEFPGNFWSFKHAPKFVRKKDGFPQIGLLSVAATLPTEQEKRLVDLNMTDRDLALQVVADERDVRSTKAADVLTHKIITCRADDEVQRAVDTMAKHPLRRMSLVDNNEKIIGIITQADVATHMDHRKKLPGGLENSATNGTASHHVAPVEHPERRQVFMPYALACSVV
jgi:CBS-domain-containing membrane protein